MRRWHPRVVFLVSAAALVAVIGCNGAPGEASGESAAADVAATIGCKDHGISRCPFCDPGLLETLGFCGEHGVPEAICTRCRDDLEAAFRAAGDWCGEHGLPESHCEICSVGALDRYALYRPEGAAPEVAVPDADLVFDGEPRSSRPPAVACDTDASVIRFANADIAGSAGLEVEEIRSTTLRRSLEAPATVEYDARRYAHLAPRAEGSVVLVSRELGAAVQAGDPLVVLECPALGDAKAQWHQAAARVALWERNSAREHGLLAQSLTTERDALEAEALLAESRIELAVAQRRLADLGLPPHEIAAVSGGDTSSRLTVRAPFAGTVVALDTALGERADPSKPLVSVADTSVVWVVLDIDPADLHLVAVGQPVLLAAEGQAGETMGGLVTWIRTDVDPRTRTVKVHAEFKNVEGHLRVRSFAVARIVTRDDEPAVLVPKTALQWDGCCNVAFERRSTTEFVPRKLLLGHDAGEYVEVLEGLRGGELVVTRGSFLLKTELLKGSIGAGCCEVNHLDR